MPPTQSQTNICRVQVYGQYLLSFEVLEITVDRFDPKVDVRPGNPISFGLNIKAVYCSVLRPSKALQPEKRSEPTLSQ
jgi:hypothetical protein